MSTLQFVDFGGERAIDILGQDGDGAAVRLIAGHAGVRLDGRSRLLECGLRILEQLVVFPIGLGTCGQPDRLDRVEVPDAEFEPADPVIDNWAAVHRDLFARLPRGS